jgi:cobaltochelatase CobN
MRHLRIALATTTAADAIPFVSALDSINKRLNNIVYARLWNYKDAKSSPADDVDAFIAFAKTAHICIVHVMSKPPEFDALIASMKAVNVPVFLSGPFSTQNPDYQLNSTVESDDYQNIFKYLNYGGVENFENLILYLTNRFTGGRYEVNAAALPQWDGIYHPDFNYSPTLDVYMEKKLQPEKLTVGILFHQSYWHSHNTNFVDGLIQEIERQGANTLPVFLSGRKNESLNVNGFDWVIENYFIKNGAPIVDVVISTLSFSWSVLSSTGPENLCSLKKLNVPILKAILTSNSYDEWQNTPLGLSIVDISTQIALPEFDGFLSTIPIATTESTKIDPVTGIKLTVFEPIPERVNKLARLALNWGKLRRIPNNEKKVAIIFHNYPPRNDNIGKAFGLDSSASVMNILHGLQNQGYLCPNLPVDSQKLMETIMAALTNDRRWLSPKDLAERALAKIPFKQYSKWFAELPQDAQDKIVRDWGKPPGELFNFQNELLVGGVMYGNVFVGLQPPRGFTDNPAAVYHSPDLSMPHHYYAYYRWIREVFKANVIMHIGKHGTLEWLPGKSVGLTASCFPDILISDLPNIYPYIINNPSEGTQAKRRSYCCIIEHLIPVMHKADAYEELAALEVQLQEYYTAKLSDTQKLPILQKTIWQAVVEAKLDQDLELTEADALLDFDAFLERLHDYISELSDTLISHGLHVLGQPPSGERLEELIVTLMRISNGDVPSLRQAIAELNGYNYENLLANRGQLGPGGKTNGDILKSIDDLSLELVEHLNAAGFSEAEIDSILVDVLGRRSPEVQRCLSYVCRFLVPALAATTDELTNLLYAANGNYVLAGPSGAITRGMADILPTGRNFYSVDPRAIPTHAAWRVGVAMGDALLARYLKDEGKYPENVGIMMWGMGTMTTKGDDLSEILYLLGVKPVWQESSGQVTGLELISIEQLKRPRIDVTLRISGLFRDTFPNIVHLIDDAVHLVADLDESATDNYVAKHVNAEVRERTSKGDDVEKAREEASYRIFSARPGAYSCGLTRAIDSKNWKTQKDLSDIYVNWGSYAYSRKTYGVSVPEQFKLRLSKLSLTVKNDSSREYDILSCDDWYDFHGGMINAAKTLSGKTPRSYCGDSSDPERLKIRNTAEETCHVFRSRLLNPKFIEGLKKQGYQGAAELSRATDFVLGWDATVEVVEDWMWENLANKYVLDKDMQKWLEEVNPYALQNMTERLLEAIERGLWKASEEMKKELQQLYLQIEGLIEGANEKK